MRALFTLHAYHPDKSTFAKLMRAKMQN